MKQSFFTNRPIDPHAVAQVPARVAIHYKIMPIGEENGELVLAMNSPDPFLVDEIGTICRRRFKAVAAPEQDILEALKKHYGIGAETIEQMMDTVPAAAKEPAENFEYIDELNSETTISRFVNQILYEAYQNRATDIHIEAFEEDIKIRYRIDGTLHDSKIPKNLQRFQASIISRIKILAHLNIAEKRLPQDGRFKVKLKETELDLRVSLMPTAYGENAVLRILNASVLLNLNELGFRDEDQDRLQQLILKPTGIIFLTGPTGSGKTTTLYACLSRIHSPGRKIVTIEDPVEYQLKGVTQIQTNPGIGLTFANGLRSMLRHDPDIMMVGEVRDRETAETAIQIALTGHLMFSTMHTNSAAAGVTRLLEMGIAPYLITSTVECLIAQRLVRKICLNCRKEAVLSPSLMAEFPSADGNGRPYKAFEGRGCEVCQNTGYLGREAIYEILVVDDALRDLILQRATAGSLEKAAREKGMVTLKEMGWQKIRQGITTVDEVFKVIR